MATRPPRGYDDLAAEPRSVELRDYALVIRQRWKLVAVLTVLGIVLAGAYSVHKGFSYSATSEVVVQPASQGPLNPAAQPDLQVNMVTEQTVAESAPVAVLAAKNMPSSLSAKVAQGRLASHLTVTVPVNSNVLQLTWVAGSPKAARQGANAFADAYLAYRHNLLGAQVTSLATTLNRQTHYLQGQIKSLSADLSRATDGTSEHQTLEADLAEVNGRLTKDNNTLSSLPTYNTNGGTVIHAALPLSPAGLGRSVLLTLGALLGLLAGMVGAFVRDSFDDGLRDAGALERKLVAPALAVAPGAGRGRKPSGRSDLITTVARPNSAGADTYRAMRSMLTSMGAGGGLSSILVVGVDDSVSSSQVAAELGVALAESGRRTLLVAADILGSRLPQIFSLSPGDGLTNVLVGEADPVALTQRPKTASEITMPSAVARQLEVIPTGPPTARPLSVLDSVAMGRFLKSLRDQYDFVVLDSPSADAASDYLALARLVDGVVVVASQARSKGRAVADLRQGLDRIGGFLAAGILLARNPGPRRKRPADRGQPDLVSPEFAIKPGEGSRADRGTPGSSGPGSRKDRPAISSLAPREAAADGQQRLARRPS